MEIIYKIMTYLIVAFIIAILYYFWGFEKTVLILLMSIYVENCFKGE